MHELLKAQVLLIDWGLDEIKSDEKLESAWRAFNALRDHEDDAVRTYARAASEEIWKELIRYDRQIA